MHLLNIYNYTYFYNINLYKLFCFVFFFYRINSVLKTVQSYGDYEKLSMGVYENCLSLKHKDSSLSNVSIYHLMIFILKLFIYYLYNFIYAQMAEGIDWFCNFDKTIRIINTFHNYSLYPYLPYSFAAWHCLFATFTWPKITYPSSEYDVSNKCYVIIK